MNIETCIKERRSVRKYSEKEISNELFDEIIEIARYAPSWKNSQIVRYHIIKDSNIKDDIADNCVLNFDFNAKTIKRSKALILVNFVKNISGFEKDGSFSTAKGDRWEMFDAGIATQTFCLAAHSKGLGTVILGVFDEEKIGEYCDIPEGENVAALIAVGYPVEDPKSAPPRKNVEDIRSYI